MLDEITSKLCTKKMMVIDRGKRSDKQNEVRPNKNINKNPQNFLGISPVQKEVRPSHKHHDHAYQYQNPS